MHGLRIVIFSTIHLVLLPALNHASAAKFPNKPPKEHFYVDRADLLNSQVSNAIDDLAGALLAEEKIPILVVTIPSLISFEAASHSIESYATALFDEWGIGYQQRNYGILLLVSLGDRKARIELGKGWGSAHDDDSLYIMNSLIIPAFKKGDYSGGILEGVKALDKMARGLGLPKPKRPWWFIPVTILSIALVIGVIVSLFKSGRTGWGWALIAGLGLLLFFILRNAASGSGGSFGGGSSGGGGASGSW